MRRCFPLPLYVLALLPLAGCQEATEGAQLCRVVEHELEHHCGLARSACEDALPAQEGFVSDHVYTNWRVDVQDGRCWLHASDMGDGVAWPESEVTHQRFDLGVVDDETESVDAE